MSTVGAASQIRYEERVGPAPRAWLWLPVIVVITALAIAPIVVPLALLAWIINVLRYRGAVVRVDDDWVTDQASRSLRATATPIITRIRSTSSFFTAPSGSVMGRPEVIPARLAASRGGDPLRSAAP